MVTGSLSASSAALMAQAAGQLGSAVQASGSGDGLDPMTAVVELVQAQLSTSLAATCMAAEQQTAAAALNILA